MQAAGPGRRDRLAGPVPTAAEQPSAEPRGSTERQPLAATVSGGLLPQATSAPVQPRASPSPAAFQAPVP